MIVSKCGFGKVEVRFGCCWFPLPCQHFLLVEAVAVVDFLQVELEFVIISDGDVRSYERALVIVEVLSNCRQVLDGVVPLCVVCFFEFLFCLCVEGAPAIVEVLKDLVGGDVAVRCYPMVELGIILFVKGIPQVVNNPTQETFPDEPQGPNKFPLFFHLLPGMPLGGVCDRRVVGCWFLGDCVRQNVGEIV